MKSNRVSSALVNKRIAMQEHRILRRGEAHNEKRSGLSTVPVSAENETFDQAEMSRICELLRRSRASSISVSDLRSLKQLLTHPEGIAAFMQDCGALHGLIGELSGNRALLKLEAAYICANLGLGEEGHSLPVCRAAGSYLVQFLEASNQHLQEAAAWAIGNLAGTSIKCSAVLCSQGVVSHLIQLLFGPQKGVGVAASYALCHIIRVKTLLLNDELLEIAQLSSMLVSTEPDFCVLLYLLSCIPACEESMLDGRVVSKIFAVLPNLVQSKEKESLQASTALLRTAGNLSCGAGALELIAVQGAGEVLRTLLESSQEHMSKECAWLCANLLCHENRDVRNFAELAGLRVSLGNLVTADVLPVSN